MRLRLLAETYSICQLDCQAPVPDWAIGPFVSVTRTVEELSIVCPHRQVPASVKSAGQWCCLHLPGPFEFSEVGIIAAVVTPLAKAGVPVFVISTFNTDWLLIQESFQEQAVSVLQAAQYEIERDS